jgi:hypothetical protein
VTPADRISRARALAQRAVAELEAAYFQHEES